MTPLDEFMAKKANDYMAVVDTWRPQTRQFKDIYDEYKRWVGAPNGTEWTGRTSNAAYDTASTDCHGSDNTDDAAEDGGKLVTATIQYEVVEPLVNGQRLIESVLAHKDQGVSIDQSYNMAYHPAEGESDESIAKNREHVADIERQVKGYVAQWDKGCQTLKAQADAIAQKITGCINPKTALVDGRKVLRDAVAPAAGDPNATSIDYKQQYPKTPAAPTDPAAIDPTMAALVPGLDPNATKAASALPQGSLPELLDAASKAKPPIDPRVGSLTDSMVRMDPSILGRQTHVEKVPGQGLDPNSPAGKAAINSLRGMYQSQGLPPAQVEAKIQEALKAGGQDQYAVKFADPNAPSATPSEHVSRDFGEQFNKFTNGISDAATRTVDGQIEQGKILTGQAGPGAPGVAEAWKELGINAAHQVHELTTDPLAAPKMGIEQAKDFINSPSEFIGKNIILGTEGLATGGIGGEAAAGARGLLGDLTHHLPEPHTPVAGHAPETPSGAAHPAPVVDHPAPTGSDHTPISGDHSAGPSQNSGIHSGAVDSTPVAGKDYGFAPNDAFQHLANPADDFARLEKGGIPSHITDGYDQLAGRTVDQFGHEFTVPGRDGSPRWDWAGQAPNDGFAGTPTVTDHFPKGYQLDRLGSEQGAFMADDGAPLSTRSMPPGVASQYHQYVGTGQPIPADLNAEVRYGPAAPAFGQPGGANQWVVVDKTTGRQIPVEVLKQNGIIE
ncbi:TNT domain-containing protein [Mycobacteroides abscessus]|uniref:TNT domain-containing protein n=1 Tax=Mycobacteroides abscessus TaxID=36809 RepID=UPI00210347E6|nr:TNT domain-containing protein [Mycobacteroides abscessus]